MPFKSLSQPKTRLADQVYEQILQAIRSGTISPEDRIVQEKLAEEFDISRTPIREALFRMEQEGILELSGRGGFKIREFSEAEIKEIYGARAAIEGYAARILAENSSQAMTDKLRSAIRAEESLNEKTVEAYFDANRNIHRAFVEATGNRFLLEFFDNLWNRGSSFTLFSTIQYIDLEKSLGNHMVLVDAIETGNGGVAAEAMISHIRDGMELQREAGRWASL